MLTRRIIVSFLLSLSLFGTLYSQDEDPVRVDSSIVRLNVGVVDGRGRPIIDLDKSKFTVYEDGVKQEITRFAPSTAPFSVVMILDMSGSTLGFRQVIRLSAARFIDALMPEDRVAVIEFYDKINVLNDFTTDRRTILNSIQVANGRGKTQLYKALDQSLDRLSKENTRRKAIVVLTDGVDTAVRDKDRNDLERVPDANILSALRPSENDTLRRILDRSDAQGVTIFPLALPTGDPAKLADPTPRQIAMYNAARTRLQLVADRTGGTLNAIKNLEDMGLLYGRVAAELRTLYTIEYSPTNEKSDGKWRTIRIAVNDINLIARTRQGYFAK
ncbi:MAG: VWA domain-containing protein [Blastocatellia bacterium]|nr:VWA domain-containing protein [Blastocatellia bacterium]